jgi:putative peptidoglycan lipid II flippase
MAFRIPNILQNILGEGALSASFIPVYARLIAEGKHDEARRVAGAIAGLLALVVAVLVALGITTAPWLVDLLAPGWDGPKRALTVRLVQILFPGTGLLVWSAWCLGILNSHRRFFLPYFAPVVWNAAIIAATLLVPTGADASEIVIWTAWGAVAGALLQLSVQLPAARRAAAPVFRRTALGDIGVQTVFRSFGPALLTRGIVQVSAWVDGVLASFLGTGAAAALANAQLIYTLPVALFGSSVAAAALPALSAEAGNTGAAPGLLRDRIDRGLRQVAFFVIPSALAMLTLGHVLDGAIFQTGAFTRADTFYVWGILAGYSIGLLAGTLGRLFASGWFALHDTRGPLRFATVRVAITVTLGIFASLQGPALLGLDPRWGTAGITIASAIATMTEFWLLRRGLERKIGRVRLPAGLLARLWGTAFAAAAAGWGVFVIVDEKIGPLLRAVFVLLPFAVVYFGGTLLLGVAQARDLLRRVQRGR